MKRGASLGFLLLVLALTVAGGTAAAKQWKERLWLRGELARLQLQAAELKRLQAEHERLKAKQLPPGALKSMRDDLRAVARLNAELEALQTTPSSGR